MKNFRTLGWQGLNMAISERAKRSLRENGLTKYESTVYHFLLLSEPTVSSQICKATGLPDSKIYDVLTGLELASRRKTFSKSWFTNATG
jgi:hypothetical protein